MSELLHQAGGLGVLMEVDEQRFNLAPVHEIGLPAPEGGVEVPLSETGHGKPRSSGNDIAYRCPLVATRWCPLSPHLRRSPTGASNLSGEEI